MLRNPAGNNPTAWKTHGGLLAGALDTTIASRPSPATMPGCSTARSQPQGLRLEEGPARLTPALIHRQGQVITFGFGNNNREEVAGSTSMKAHLGAPSSSSPDSRSFEQRALGFYFLLSRPMKAQRAMGAPSTKSAMRRRGRHHRSSITERTNMQLAQNIQPRLVFIGNRGTAPPRKHGRSPRSSTPAQTSSVLIQQQMLDQRRKATADDNPSIPTGGETRTQPRPCRNAGVAL